MSTDRTIQGRGVLECAGRTTTATYTLILSSDDLGYPNVTGLLMDVDIEFVIEECLPGSLGCLRLEDNQEIMVRIAPRDDGSLLVQNSGAIPGL
jgi:hypothetical protein